MTNNTDTAEFIPQEIAYRLPGREWARKVCKTERSFDKAIEKLIDRGAEIRTRNADGY